ncbi:MAG: 50S ribosomal protein L30 [Desulfomonilaceae bacterium]
MPLMLKVTLKRSPIKATNSQRESVRGLGLRKLHQSRLLQDSPEVRGMVLKVSHLVELEEVAE